MPGERASLLVNFWYAHPVGHAIEALRYCLGYHHADPSLEINLLLNGATPSELAELCPFIRRTYAVAFTGFLDAATDPEPALRAVPREWDYVVDDHRGREPEQLANYAGLRRFYEASDHHFHARLARGTAGSEPHAYEPHHQLRLELSPHTGFGMAALAVGTPWLTLSGGRWPEFFFNGVPFYSVLPDPQRNAWYTFHDPPRMLRDDEDGEGPRTPSMTRARIRENLPELLEGARLLLERRLPYEDALEQHFRRMVERSGGQGGIWSFDGIHAGYVGA
jgi:hypothetical protein